MGVRCYYSRGPVGGGPLHDAAAAADMEGLARLLQQHPPGAPLPADTAGNTPLHAACAAGRLGAAWALLGHCSERMAAELAATNAFGWQPAHSLCANPNTPGAAQTLHLLLKCGATVFAPTIPVSGDPQLECFAGDTCLALAAAHASSPAALPVLHALLCPGGDPLEPAGWQDTSPLEYACAGGDVATVELLLKAAPFSPRYRQQGLNVPYLLALAVAHGCADVAELLLCPPSQALHRVLTYQLEEAQQQEEEPEEDGEGQQWRWEEGPGRASPDPCSVLEVAGGRSGSGDGGSREMSEDGGSGEPGQSLSCSYDPHCPTVEPCEADWCLRLAIRGGSLELVRLLAARGGASGSHWRCRWQQLDDLDEFMEGQGVSGRFPLLHATMGPCQEYADTPLSLALRKQQLHIAEWLVKRTRAAFPRCDAQGRTGLHWTTRLGQAGLLSWLLETGQYRLRVEGGRRFIDVEDRRGFSALALALTNGHVEAAELLLRHGADVHRIIATPDGNNSPVGAALECEDQETRRGLLALLLQYGAEVDGDDLHAAVEHGHAAELCSLLRTLRLRGAELEPREAGILLLRAAQAGSCECLEAALLEGLSPAASYSCRARRGQPTTEISLLEACFARNRLMWRPAFGYNEAEGRLGWRTEPNGSIDQLCWFCTRALALRALQSLVLAGADPAPVLQQIEEGQGEDAAALGNVAAVLRHPVWLPQQHGQWPTPFRAAVAALLCGLHRAARQLAAAAAAGDQAEGHAMEPAGQAPVFPAGATFCITAHLAAQWAWPAAADGAA
ncbi:hypothetical protein ABPG75_006808 [Micractinium tetrahymenae]